MNSPVLARLTLTFHLDGLSVRTLYCYGGADPSPGTAAHRRDAAELTRDGLVRALKALGGGPVEYLSANDFQIREDSLLAGSLSSFRETGEGWSAVRRMEEALSGAIHDSLGEHHSAELGKLVGD